MRRDETRRGERRGERRGDERRGEERRREAAARLATAHADSQPRGPDRVCTLLTSLASTSPQATAHPYLPRISPTPPPISSGHGAPSCARSAATSRLSRRTAAECPSRRGSTPAPGTCQGRCQGRVQDVSRTCRACTCRACVRVWLALSRSPPLSPSRLSRPPLLPRRLSPLVLLPLPSPAASLLQCTRNARRCQRRRKGGAREREGGRVGAGRAERWRRPPPSRFGRAWRRAARVGEVGEAAGGRQRRSRDCRACVMVRNRSCPAVSQICSLIRLPPSSIVLILKSTARARRGSGVGTRAARAAGGLAAGVVAGRRSLPIVGSTLSLKSSSAKRTRRAVFPTAWSPIIMSCGGQGGE